MRTTEGGMEREPVLQVDAKRFGAWLRALRKERKITQAELERRLELTRGYLYALEKGKRGPGPRLLEKLAAELEMTPEAMMLLSGAALTELDKADVLSQIGLEGHIVVTFHCENCLSPMAFTLRGQTADSLGEKFICPKPGCRHPNVLHVDVATLADLLSLQEQLSGWLSARAQSLRLEATNAPDAPESSG